MKKIAVIGAGMAGLSAAYHLQKKGFDVTVFEQESFLGGRAATVREEGVAIDVGAVYILPTYVNALKIIDELGLRSSLQRVAPVLGILRDGKVHQLDLGRPIVSFIKTPLFSWKSKLLLLKLLPSLLKLWSKLDFKNMGSIAGYDNESVKEYCLRVLNEELHDYFLDPIVRMNMLNNTEEARSGEIFWLLKSFATPQLSVMKNGTGTLAEAIAKECKVLTTTPVTAVERIENNDAPIAISFQQEGLGTQYFDGCVVATPPNVIMALVPAMGQAEAQFFKQIRPVKHFIFHFILSKKLDFDESIILGSDKEAPAILGIVIDPNRAPDRTQQGQTLVTLWLSQEWSAQHWSLSDEQTIEKVLATIKPIVGDFSELITRSFCRRNDYSCFKSYPDFYGHVNTFVNNRTTLSNIQFAGDFTGMGIEGAVISGETAANALNNQVSL